MNRLRDVRRAALALALALAVGAIGVLGSAALARPAGTGSTVRRFLFACTRHVGRAAGGHGVHLLLLGGAVAAYAGYVAVGVARGGLPRFSWRLRPPED